MILSRFLDYLRYELNRAPLTVKAYENDILQFQDWLGGKNEKEIDYTSVSQSDVRAWLAFLARNGESPKTIRRKSQSLRALFKWMMKSGIIKISPMRDLPLPKVSKPLPDIVRKDEIENALDSLETGEENNQRKIRDALIVEIFYTLGIRKAELITLNDSSISFSKGEIKVMGKRSKQRIVPVPEALLNKIRHWQTVRDDNNVASEDQPLFSINGKRISEKTVYNIVNKALADSSAKKRSPHALRHSFASGMLNGGADIDSVKEFLGHASLATTQIYTHISLNEIKKAYSLAHPRSSKLKK
ncbi:MAG: tyrosine-type recombinase/integrase [Muribaculaceae bacterium]|nr:tyrosine-type recombinase/integrase [Muribaculaceae bacterium]